MEHYRAMLGQDLMRCNRGATKGKDNEMYHSQEQRNPPTQTAWVGWDHRTRNQYINIAGSYSQIGGVRDWCRGGVTWVSYLYLDGVIRTLPHVGAPCESQILQGHTHLLTCVVQEEW